MSKLSSYLSAIKNTLYICIFIYVMALLGIYVLQRNFLYFPNSINKTSASKIPPGFKELIFKTEDGLNLKEWYAPATRKKLTLVFFHGNGSSMSMMSFISKPYIKAGYGFLLTEYRGYGGMPGKPTEEGLYADARASLKSLIASGVKEEDIVLFGHSLGTGVATQMATEFHVRGLILFAPYLSITKMAQIRFPYFPVEYLTKDRYENFKKIPNIYVPVLISCGGKDAVIPPAQGRELFALANEPKQFLFIPGGGHDDLSASEFIKVSLKWLQALSIE